MTTIMEALGLTKERMFELNAELAQKTEELESNKIVEPFLATAKGKPTGEILYLGTVLRDFVRYATGE